MRLVCGLIIACAFLLVNVSSVSAQDRGAIRSFQQDVVSELQQEGVSSLPAALGQLIFDYGSRRGLNNEPDCSGDYGSDYAWCCRVDDHNCNCCCNDENVLCDGEPEPEA